MSTYLLNEIEDRRVHRVYWCLRNTSWLCLSLNLPTANPLVMWAERIRSTSHSVWGLIAQQGVMCHCWSMNHEEGGERPSWRFLHSSFIMPLNLWHTSILFSSSSSIHFPSICPKRGDKQALHSIRNYLTFIAAPARPYKQVKNIEQKAILNHSWDKWAFF